MKSNRYRSSGPALTSQFVTGMPQRWRSSHGRSFEGAGPRSADDPPAGHQVAEGANAPAAPRRPSLQLGGDGLT